MEADQAREAAKEAAGQAKEALQRKWEEMLEPAAGTDSCVDVLVRLPNGVRLRRRFEDSTPISELFEFVEVSWQPAKGTKARDFALSTDFPKRIFDRDTVEEFGTTLANEGLGPQQLFMIQWK